MSVVIYHNPRCSKSRQTLALLEENGIQPEVIKYLDTPPSVDELKTLLSQLELTDVRKMMRTKEDIYKELELKEADTSISCPLAVSPVNKTVCGLEVIAKDWLLGAVIFSVPSFGLAT